MINTTSILRLAKEFPEYLYHTTSLEAAEKIIESGTLIPKDQDAFVSFSSEPIHGGDIEGNDVILKVKKPDDVMKVKYNEDWFEKYPEHAAYIAGEGWQEQFEFSMDTLDEEGFPDPDKEEEEFLEGMFEAFIMKEPEQEWISIEQGESVHIEIIDIEEV